MTDLNEYEHHRTVPDITKCRFRTVLEGREVECPFKGPHPIHKYIAPKSGRIYRFEIVELGS